MEVSSQFLNCSGLPPVSQLKAANIANTVFTTVCLTFILFQLALLVLYKAYRTTLQRLLIYITISVALTELDTISSVVIQFDIDHRVCMWIGFVDVWSNYLMEFFSFGFTVCLITITMEQLRGKKTHFWVSWICCRGKHGLLVEMVYTFVTILLPLSFIWIHMYNHTYGLGETVCVMRALNDQCQPLNQTRIDYISFQLLWLAADILVVLSFLVLIGLLTVKLKRYYSKGFNISTFGFLSFALVISLTIRIAETVVNLFNRFYGKSIDHLAYDVIANSAYTISNMIIPIAFAVYIYSPNKLRPKSLREAARKWRRRQHSPLTRQLRDIEADGAASVENSVKVHIPSHTTYNYSIYTGEFTDATQPLISEAQENERDKQSYKALQQ